MKKLLLFLFAIVLISTLLGCEDNGRGSSGMTSNKKAESVFTQTSNSSSDISELPVVSKDESKIVQKHYANFYIASYPRGILEVKEVEFDGTIDGLVTQLIEFSALPYNTKIFSIEVKEKTAFVEISREFGYGLTGEVSQNAFTSSLVNTLLDFSGADFVKIDIKDQLFANLDAYKNPLPRFENVSDDEAKAIRKGHFTVGVVEENDMVIDFSEKDIDFNGTIESVIGTLVKEKALPAGTKPLSFRIEGSTGYLDLSKEFLGAIDDGKYLNLHYLTQLSNTMLDCFGLSNFYLTVEGEIIDTGLVRYDTPFIRSYYQ